MKKSLYFLFLSISSLIILCTSVVFAQTLPFQLIISGAGISVDKTLYLSDLDGNNTQMSMNFQDNKGKKYQFDLKYKKLPSNRSFPGHLDITLKDVEGNKLGYLFFAINGVDFLKKMGEFGLMVNVDGQLVDVKFVFDAHKKGQFNISGLDNERFVQDTLVPKFHFQMIRPVLIPKIKSGLRSQTYKLDDYSFTVNYTLMDLEQGLVQFQYNLNHQQNNQEQLLERIYFNADSIDTLREGMFVGKYFDKQVGTFKLVFYPAMGQTSVIQ
jgi:hypothetical protein